MEIINNVEAVGWFMQSMDIFYWAEIKNLCFLSESRENREN